MYLEQSIDHRARRIDSRVTGSVGVGDVRDHIERESKQGALSYPEFVDGSAANPEMSSDDIRSIVQLLAGYARRGPVGPTAVLVSSDFAYGTMRMIEAMAEPHCAIRPFRTRAEAEAWLIAASPPPVNHH
jgi:hypothetical protein